MEICSNLKKILETRQPQIENENDYFSSAILIPLVSHKGQLRVLFEVRASELSWQPGEICFPGGRIEEQDPNPFCTAIRETHEEIGVPHDQIEPIGAIDYIVSPIGVILYPFVGYIKDAGTVKPSCSEVGKIFSVPLDYLLTAEPVIGNMQLATRPAGNFPLHMLPDTFSRDWKSRAEYEVMFYQYKEYIIWGLTARVLHKFIQICKEIR